MRYAIFSDIHANLEALEAVLAKMDELAQEEPIDAVWFLGDLVGYGPDPNECIVKLRERTDVIIAGNHDWAAVGKIDLEDFSAAARISAEWTAEQLTEEHRTFLANLPERLELGEVTLVHGSPYGPLWEYLTSDVLAERSFQYFSTRYCFVGHTHVPVIFQQPDAIANTPTLPLSKSNGVENHESPAIGDDEETVEMVAVRPPIQQSTFSTQGAASAMSAYKDPESGQTVTEDEANAILEDHMSTTDEVSVVVEEATEESTPIEELTTSEQEITSTPEIDVAEEQVAAAPEDKTPAEENTSLREDTVEEKETAAPADSSAGVEESSIPKEGDTITADTTTEETVPTQEMATLSDSGSEMANIDYMNKNDVEESAETTAEQDAEGEVELNSEIEELLTLLGLSQSMIKVTNEMITPPEGHWESPEGYRAIINPGGIGQPRDGDPRAAFMIYDTERGFEFYRVPYPFEKTQEKIIEAGLPPYLAVRLAYGR